MTNKEAIGVLSANVLFACEKANLSKACIASVESALNVAISALEWKDTIEKGCCASKKDEIKLPDDWYDRPLWPSWDI